MTKHMRSKIKTVQDLIDKLNAIEDKTKEIIIDNIYNQNKEYTINEIEEFSENVYIWLDINNIIKID